MNATAHKAEFTPEWSIHPGAVLREILEKRSIRQTELAERTGLTPKHVNQITKEQIGISGDVAIRFERVLGVPTQFWMRLEADYATHSSRERARRQLPEFAEWAKGFNETALRHHNIVDPADDQSGRIEKILTFFGVASPDAFHQAWIRPRTSFRRSQSFTVEEQDTALWLRLVERNAERAGTGPLKPRTLRDVARTLPAMTHLGVVNGFLAARAALAEAGVTLTFVREVPGTRVCGATWWLDKDRPVIGVTERHRKADIFWFNVAHEMGHIALHPSRTTFLDLDAEKRQKDPAEREADDFAEKTLIPQGAEAQIRQAGTRQELALLAARLGVGAAIVAGRHGHLTGNWTVGAQLRSRIEDKDIEALEQLES
jgi:HTH-type transcriptional regulator/antitoxin HigA